MPPRAAYQRAQPVVLSVALPLAGPFAAECAQPFNLEPSAVQPCVAVVGPVVGVECYRLAIAVVAVHTLFNCCRLAFIVVADLILAVGRESQHHVDAVFIGLAILSAGDAFAVVAVVAISVVVRRASRRGQCHGQCHQQRGQVHSLCLHVASFSCLWRKGSLAPVAVPARRRVMLSETVAERYRRGFHLCFLA